MKLKLILIFFCYNQYIKNRFERNKKKMKKFKELFTEAQEKENQQEETDLERVIKFTHIGFSHKKMFKPSAWNRAVKVMDKLIELGLVVPYDFGRGKGKYTTTALGDKYEIDELGKIAYDAGVRIKPMRARKKSEKITEKLNNLSISKVAKTFVDKYNSTPDNERPDDVLGAWEDYKDMLFSSGIITKTEYERWGTPSIVLDIINK